MTDRFGREFAAGLRVVYPTRRGSDLKLLDGVISKVVTTTRMRRDLASGVGYTEQPWCKLYIAREVKNWRGEVRRHVVVIHEIDRVVVIPECYDV